MSKPLNFLLSTGDDDVNFSPPTRIPHKASSSRHTPLHIRSAHGSTLSGICGDQNKREPLDTPPAMAALKSYQRFRSRDTVIRIEAHQHPGRSGCPIVIWSDIQACFPGVVRIQDQDIYVPFERDEGLYRYVSFAVLINDPVQYPYNVMDKILKQLESSHTESNIAPTLSWMSFIGTTRLLPRGNITPKANRLTRSCLLLGI